MQARRIFLVHHVIDILTPSSLLFEIRHVGRVHGDSIEFESTQCRYFSPVVVLDKDRDGLDALVVNELQLQTVGIFLQILRGQFKGGRRIDVLDILESQIVAVDKE